MRHNAELTRWYEGPVKAAETAAAAAEYETLYPEIYYQLQPYVIEACDYMDACGGMAPTREQLKKMGDRIEMQFTGAAAAMAMAVPDVSPAALRSGGLFRDLLDILLLQELFGRRRRYW